MTRPHRRCAESLPVRIALALSAVTMAILAGESGAAANERHDLLAFERVSDALLADHGPSITLVLAHPGHPGGELVTLGPWLILLAAGGGAGLFVWRLARLGRGGEVGAAEQDSTPDEPLVRSARPRPPTDASTGFR